MTSHGPYSVLAATAAIGLFAGGCGGDDSSPPLGQCSGAIEVGSLVITEIYGNSPGADEGNEWFEIYNAGPEALNLRGLSLRRSDQEGEGRREHLMRETVIQPGQYFVVGQILDEFRPDYIDYAYGPDLGSMSNTAGRLELACADTVIDRVDYFDLPEGRSIQLSGIISPDHIANDDPANFCAGSQNAFFQDQLGTPRMRNELCAPANQTECIDGENQRDVVRPQPGDIEISEFLANPDALLPDQTGCDTPCRVSDDDGEWIELRINASIDLNGLQLGRAEFDTGPGDVRDTIAAVDCIEVEPGDYFVLARSTDAALNGGVDADYPLNFGLTNSDDGIFIASQGTVLDVQLYSSTRAGVAIQVDLEGDVCDATEPYGLGDLGTPGAANGECETVVVVPDGMCIDADTQTVRNIVSPGVGQVRISEWLPNPKLVSDSAGEWIEFTADGGGPYDLNGMSLVVGTGTSNFLSDTCLEIAANGQFLVARGDDPMVNGGLPAVDLVRTFGLTNSGLTMTLNLGATEIDSASYAASTEARAIQIAGDGSQCNATTLYNGTDYGTPGATNDASCN